MWWDAEAGEWTGHDVLDFPAKMPPHYEPPEGATGPEAIGGDDAFIMQADGKGCLYAPKGLLDGPMPAHFEPSESLVANAGYPQRQSPTWAFYQSSS